MSENGRPDCDEGALTSREHWDAGWTRMPSKNFWSLFDVSSRDIQRLLKKEIVPGAQFLEIGFGPGKLLAWAGLKRGAVVSGVDYSGAAVDLASRYFAELGLPATLKAEDIFETSFPDNSFDIVFSNGLIEHFTDPVPIVRKHLDLARPGGRVVILVPNYGGFWGRVQQWLDPENLAIHNRSIMFPDRMQALFAGVETTEVSAFYLGRPSIWHLSLSRKLGRGATLIQRFVGLSAAISPSRLGRFSPMVAVVATKGAARG